MDSDPGDETLRSSQRAGFADAVTFAFGDPAGESYGLMRIGVQSGAAPAASVLALRFAGGEVVDAVARGGIELADPAWEAIEAGPLRFEIEEPLAAWRVRWDGDLDLRFAAGSPPIESAAGGMEGYEQLCRVEGTAGGRRVACLGQRGHSWGVADWDAMALARTVCAWWGEDRAILLTAVRPADARHHSEEEVTAHLVDGEPLAVAEPRLSTTYDAEGRQRRASLELYMTDDDEYPRRVAGQVVCGTSLELGRLRLECAFFEWRSAGRSGPGRYDVLRRA